MICSRCHHPNPDGASTCANCGNVLIVTMPTPPAGMHSVPNHLVWAILMTLFCCLPGGIVALVYASRVDALMSGRQFDAAREASDKARFWCLVSLFTPILGFAAYLLLIAFGLGLGALSGGGY